MGVFVLVGGVTWGGVGATPGIHEYFNNLAASQIAFCQAPANHEHKQKMEEKKSLMHV